MTSPSHVSKLSEIAPDEIEVRASRELAARLERIQQTIPPNTGSAVTHILLGEIAARKPLSPDHLVSDMVTITRDLMVLAHKTNNEALSQALNEVVDYLADNTLYARTRGTPGKEPFIFSRAPNKQRQ